MSSNNRRRRLRQALLGVGLALSIVEAAVEKSHAQASPGPAGAGKKTIARKADFIIIHGSQLAGTLNQEIPLLGLYAKTGNQVQPIPFQIDEIDAEGEWVLPIKSPSLKRPGKEDKDDNALFDENDEMVFMIADSGDRILAADYPSGARAVDEIMLVDPLDKGKSWVYLCVFPAPPRPSPVDYVTYSVLDNRIISSALELGFSSEVPITWDHLSFIGMPNMLDRMKIRFKVKVIGMQFYRDETDFSSELISFKDGPVRVIRRVRNSFQINRILKTPYAASETIYYSNAILMPYRIKVPINLKALSTVLGIGEIKVRGGPDGRNLNGWRLKTDMDPRWLEIDGKMDQVEKNIITEGVKRFILAGPQGAFLCRIILDKTPDGSAQDIPIKTRFFYVDDNKTPEPPEFVPGQSPNLGFWMRGIEELEKGTFYFYIIGYMIKNYQEGMETGYLNILDQPIQAIVNNEQLN